jgi:hypothetical protein
MQGTRTQVQLSFISSYTTIRIWKLLYKDGSCFIRASDGKHICKGEVAKGFALDPAKDIPKGIGNAVAGCMLER